MERRLFKGQYSTTKEPATVDIFIDITSSLQKCFEYEYENKLDLNYLINCRNKVIVVTITGQTDAVFVARMTECEKVICESIFDMQKTMSDYNLSENEVTSMLTGTSYFDFKNQPKKRVYTYQMELEAPEPEHVEVLDIAVNLLKEIC
jgi:hypothetical protein